MDFEIIKAGFFDSNIVFKNETGAETVDRLVTCYEIEIFTEGNGISYINRVAHPIQKGFVLLAKPGQMRHSKLHFQCNYIHLNFKNEVLESQINALPDFFEISGEQRYHDILFKILNAMDGGFVASNLYINSKIYELLYMLCTDATRIQRTSVRYDKNTLLRAQQYINQNYNQNLSLKEIAGYVNLSPIYFHNLFRAFTGKTPHDYLLEVRLSRAKHLLSFTQMSVEEVAFKTGFSSQSYFNAVFKKELHTTPTQFRKDEMLKYE